VVWRKVGLFALALVAATFGAWIITVPIFLYLFISLLLTKKMGASPSRSLKRGSVGKRRTSVWKYLGLFLVALSFVAFLSGGTLSPVVLIIIGFVVLFKPRSFFGVSSRVKPVENSVLLRARLLPFRWFAMAEAKVSTRDPEGALSGIKQRLLLVSAPALRIFLVFSATSITLRRAEGDLLERMQTAAWALSPLGVYLLPLDSKEAAGLSRAGRELDLPSKSLHQFLLSADYGAVVVEAENGFVVRLGFYARGDDKKGSGSPLSGPGMTLGGSVLLREVLQAVSQKLGRLQPDRYATFLSTMAATAGETLGQRIIQTQGADSEILLAASLGSPQVELSRAQLRALVCVYE